MREAASSRRRRPADVTIVVAANAQPDLYLPVSTNEDGSANAGMGTVVGAAAVPSVSWISVRPEDWSSVARNRALSPLNYENLSFRLMLGEPLFGVTCLVFGVGTSGAGWINRLAQSDWFSGLEPREEDLAASGGVAAGRWVMKAGSTGNTSRIDADVSDFVAGAAFPDTPLAAIAVPRDTEQGDLTVVLSLVAALRQRRDATGCRVAVIVTVEAGIVSACGFIPKLLERGAFVVQAGLGASGDHFHHFPLRVAIMPPRGRLVCVDLADHLACWKSGSTADLHVIASDIDVDAQVLSRLSELYTGVNRVRALILHAHLDPDAPGNRVAALDHIASQCRNIFLRPDDNVVFTTADRMDGITGSADLLLIHDGTAING